MTGTVIRFIPQYKRNFHLSNTGNKYFVK